MALQERFNSVIEEKKALYKLSFKEKLNLIDDKSYCLYIDRVEARKPSNLEHNYKDIVECFLPLNMQMQKVLLSQNRIMPPNTLRDLMHKTDQIIFLSTLFVEIFEPDLGYERLINELSFNDNDFSMAVCLMNVSVQVQSLGGYGLSLNEEGMYKLFSSSLKGIVKWSIAMKVAIEYLRF